MSDIGHRDIEDVERIAAEKGLDCFISKPDELLLDLDTIPDAASLDSIRLALEANDGLKVVKELVTTSPGGKRKHMYLRLNRSLQPMTRVALQACLGSDPMREALSVLRVMAGSGDCATALFETKVQGRRVRKWREPEPPRQILTDDDVPF